VASFIFAGEIEINFKNSLDNSNQKAMAYIPAEKEKKESEKLLGFIEILKETIEINENFTDQYQRILKIMQD
jgi:hypothetical protein